MAKKIYWNLISVYVCGLGALVAIVFEDWKSLMLWIVGMIWAHSSYMWQQNFEASHQIIEQIQQVVKERAEQLREEQA